MSEDINVYNSIRENILHIEDRILNSTIYMYVIYFAILTISATSSALSSWAILFTFVDLIVFQSLINNELWSLKKASIYINVFFESKRNDMHWELMHRDENYDKMYSRTNKNIGWYIYKSSAAFLATISLLVLTFSELHVFTLDNSADILHSVSSIVKLSLSAILYVLTIHINRLYFRMRSGKMNANTELFNFLEQFYAKTATTKYRIALIEKYPYEISLEKEDEANPSSSFLP